MQWHKCLIKTLILSENVYYQEIIACVTIGRQNTRILYPSVKQVACGGPSVALQT